MHDVIICGGGPAGITAGIYASRARLKTVVVEKLMPGGQAAVTDFIENYPGFPEGIGGSDLMNHMQEQAQGFGCEFDVGEVSVVDMKKKTLTTPLQTYEWKSLIIATGADPRRLDIPGEEQFMGRGVSFCATCDGALFSGRPVAVVGGGDSAVKEALFLTKFSSRIYVIHRRQELRAEKIIQEKAFENEKIEFIWDSVVTKIMGTQRVENLLVKDVKTEEESELPVDGVFIYIGRVPNTSLFEVKKDSAGYIITDEDMNTSIKGVFAAGDCRKKAHRQVATAVGDGAAAAMSAEAYIAEHE
jgi:thioredoxin reductase (NADPH)